MHFTNRKKLKGQLGSGKRGLFALKHLSLWDVYLIEPFRSLFAATFYLAAKLSPHLLTDHQVITTL